MKRCPECRRDYYDDTLSYCLADGTELVYGLSDNDPATAILSESTSLAGGTAPSESPTRAEFNATGESAVLPGESSRAGGSPTTSSAEFLFGRIKRNRRMASLGSLVVLLARRYWFCDL